MIGAGRREAEVIGEVLEVVGILEVVGLEATGKHLSQLVWSPENPTQDQRLTTQDFNKDEASI